MEYKTTQKLQTELSSGESLLWTGRPKQGLLLRGSDVIMIPFSLVWGGFAIFWEYTAYTSEAPFFFPFIWWGIRHNWPVLNIWQIYR